MSADIKKLETRPDRLWREFLEAQERAKSTLDIKDAAAAGRAWSRFLAEFVPDGNTKEAVHGDALRRR